MQEWYLMTPSTRPNLTGGYENDAFLDYKEDAFIESLGTDIATSVTLYSSDLSEKQEIRCIIQGNVADTQLKSIERVGLFIIGTVKAGMYIFYENRYWLIIGYPGNNGIYEKAVMVLCQYKLRWQNAKGNIIERWCNATSASKYDIGESGNMTITLASNTFTLLLPDDFEVLKLDGKRVFIDRNPVNPMKVFKITRNDDILNYYGTEDHGGVLSFIADRGEFNKNADNQELRICDYHSSTTPIEPDPTPDDPDEIPLLSAIISGNSNVRIGFERTYSVSFKDADGNLVDSSDVNFEWNIASEFSDKIDTDIRENTIKVRVNDDSLSGESFLLQIIIDGDVISRANINIIQGY